MSVWIRKVNISLKVKLTQCIHIAIRRRDIIGPRRKSVKNIDKIVSSDKQSQNVIKISLSNELEILMRTVDLQDQQCSNNRSIFIIESFDRKYDNFDAIQQKVCHSFIS